MLGFEDVYFGKLVILIESLLDDNICEKRMNFLINQKYVVVQWKFFVASNLEYRYLLVIFFFL